MEQVIRIRALQQTYDLSNTLPVTIRSVSCSDGDFSAPPVFCSRWAGQRFILTWVYEYGQ
jgi:hypothetical protein